MDCAFLSLLGWAGLHGRSQGAPSCTWEQPLPALAWPWMAVGREGLCPLSSGGRLAGRAGSCGPQSLSWLQSPMFTGPASQLLLERAKL